jgi:hypothetical protein
VQKFLAMGAALLLPIRPALAPAVSQTAAGPSTFLGFDRNHYPGDSALQELRRTFSFAGYWLNNPPGENFDDWLGKRGALRDAGFGFLALFNGRLDNQLKKAKEPATLGAADAQQAVSTARDEGFSAQTIIFLDQEEGGRMLPEQSAYLFAWIDGVFAAGFRAGVYCSGMPASEGKGRFVVTANDIRDHAAGREIAFFVYNDACPPSPGCAYPPSPPQPSSSGVAFASVWQFAQSPRRHEFTAQCAATYRKDGNCYSPGTGVAATDFLDLDLATSPDPSGRH